ncbi:hypothetical protein, partial [Klebsiella pneumoniae]|uniref:hypothetical protein n=1 Tax=Klebsiella pneumoniae TaxID=573 RepID=UPI001CA33C8B
RAYCLKTQPATGETYPKSDLFNKAVCLLSGGDGVKKNRWERRAKSHPGLNILAICHPAYTFN